MQNVIDIFKDFCKIPHCSGDTKELKDFIVSFSKSFGYSVETDDAGNIMVRSKNAKVTLQAHYDMVCIGNAPNIEPIEKDGWMFAKDSSLGADNGIAVAMMLLLIQNNTEADFLFTNDEEIGLVGAEALTLKIDTPYLLNLDSEELGKVYIGCAGGGDIYAKKSCELRVIDKDMQWYEVESFGIGGHSGVNIADKIDNAIIELIVYLMDHNAHVSKLSGGERLNAIPKYAKAIVAIPKGVEFRKRDNISFKKIEYDGLVVSNKEKFFIDILIFKHGVYKYNLALNIPQTSVNLAKVEFDDGLLTTQCSFRAMSDEDLDEMSKILEALGKLRKYSVEINGKYPAWKPTINEFSEKVLEYYKAKVPNAEYAAIHAGLECALFAQKYPNLKIASIGPTILDPHSDRERVEIDSVFKVLSVVKNLLKTI